MIFVIGGAGSIGSELAKQLSKNNKVVAIDQDETGLFEIGNVIPEICNIRDFSRLEEIFDKYRPRTVFHAAAYKHLSGFEEEHYTEIVSTNINGTVNILKLANKYKVKKFVFISTDKAVNPSSLMGATKLIGEIITKRNKFTVVRFGNVLGSKGSVTTVWKRQKDNNEPITVTDERMQRYFMTIPEACSLVIKASQEKNGGTTFILDMGEPVKIIDMARKFSDNIKIIGKKESEKLSEELMTADERSRAIKKGRYWVIKNG